MYKRDDKVVSLHAFKLAKTVCKEVPEILKLLTEMQEKLDRYGHYSDVYNLLFFIYESKDNFKIHLDRHKRFLKKGKDQG